MFLSYRTTFWSADFCVLCGVRGWLLGGAPFTGATLFFFPGIDATTDCIFPSFIVTVTFAASFGISFLLTIPGRLFLLKSYFPSSNINFTLPSSSNLTAFTGNPVLAALSLMFLGISFSSYSPAFHFLSTVPLELIFIFNKCIKLGSFNSNASFTSLNNSGFFFNALKSIHLPIKGLFEFCLWELPMPLGISIFLVGSLWFCSRLVTLSLSGFGFTRFPYVLNSMELSVNIE